MHTPTSDPRWPTPQPSIFSYTFPDFVLPRTPVSFSYPRAPVPAVQCPPPPVVIPPAHTRRHRSHIVSCVRRQTEHRQVQLPAHVNLTRTLPVSYEQAVHMASYWRSVSSFLGYVLFIANEFVDPLSPDLFLPDTMAVDRYRTLLRNGPWPYGLPDIHHMSLQEMLNVTRAFVLSYVPLPLLWPAHSERLQFFPSDALQAYALFLEVCITSY